MKHTSQSIREALEAGKRVLLCGDEVAHTAQNLFAWRGYPRCADEFNTFLRELQDKVEIVEPEPLWIETTVFSCSPTLPDDWWPRKANGTVEPVILIRKSDLPEALKQLAETAKEGEER